MISGSISKRRWAGHREQVDYMPTQMITEWFRSTSKNRNCSIDSIYYRSVLQEGGRSLVLFADRRDLRFTDDEIEALTKSDSQERWMLKWRQKQGWLQLVQVKLQRAPKSS